MLDEVDDVGLLARAGLFRVICSDLYVRGPDVTETIRDFGRVADLLEARIGVST